MWGGGSDPEDPFDLPSDPVGATDAKRKPKRLSPKSPTAPTPETAGRREYPAGLPLSPEHQKLARDHTPTAKVNGKPWDKTAPAPRLPQEVIAKTAAKYREALTRLTGA